MHIDSPSLTTLAELRFADAAEILDVPQVQEAQACQSGVTHPASTSMSDSKSAIVRCASTECRSDWSAMMR